MDTDTKLDAGDRRPAARWDVLTIVLCVACIALTLLVFLLARQNRALKAHLTALMTQTAQSDPNALKAGDFVAPFDAVAGPGETTRVEFGTGEARTLLLVFSPDCSACRTNMPVWERVLANPIPPSIRVLGIRTASSSPGGDRDAEVQTRFRAYSLTTPLGKLPYVPATVLLDDHGMVLQVWFGVLGDSQEAELQAALQEAPASS